MAKLYFKYGTMNSSKTANLLMAAHTYETQGKRVLCYKPLIDTRWTQGEITSRSGIESRKCGLISEETNIYLEVKKDIQENGRLYYLLIDEAQFLSLKHVKQLVKIADELDVPVMCYGLKNSYKDGVLFEGSKALLYYADKLEEIKTGCQFCNRKAIMNLRVVNGKPVYSGETEIVIGDTKEGEEYYIQTCREHYYNPKI